MAQGEVLDQRELSVQAEERKDWLGCGPTRSVYGLEVGHFEKTPDLSHTQANIILGEQRDSCSHMLVTCTFTVHSPNFL